MSRMRRTLASVVGVLALAGVLAGTAHGQAGRPQWQVHAVEQGCIVIRMPATADEPTLAIRHNRYGVGLEVILSGPNLPMLNGPVRLIVDGEAWPVEESVTRQQQDGSRIFVTRSLRGEVLAALRDAREIGVRRGGRILLSVPVAVPQAAHEAVQACQEQALADIGFGSDVLRPTPMIGDTRDPSAFAPIGKPGSWLQPTDYPPLALREGRIGDVGILLAVEPDGRISRCRQVLSSGHRDLDDATCAAVMRSGRYDPFDGGPVLVRLVYAWRIG